MNKFKRWLKRNKEGAMWGGGLYVGIALIGNVFGSTSNAGMIFSIPNGPALIWALASLPGAMPWFFLGLESKFVIVLTNVAIYALIGAWIDAKWRPKR